MNTAANIGFTLHGTGPEGVLVMHDWMGDSTIYDAILPYLDKSVFAYAFVDLRGYGLSRDIAGEYTVGEIAHDCLAVADKLGWQRFHVMGHSMTGMATERMAADAPSRVKSAIAVCPVSAAGNQIDANAKAFFASTTESDDAFRRLIKFVGPGLSDSWAEAKLRLNRSAVSPACRLRYLAMLTETNFVEDVVGLETPFLVVIAQKDPGLDEAAMKKTFLAWHPNAELVTIPNSGHYPMQECPPHFVSVVEGFLRKHKG
ncbi:MAG: alpha/beta hydrolase [Proteobacteria bacterium]|nr:alpha/beta hydrolase [Pseudomonadota bacterium]